MSNLPENFLYTDDHEWVGLDEAAGTATVGVTEFAAKQLGDVVYVDLPAEGDTVTAGETMGEIESTKSVSDLFSPLTGEVVEVNQEVVDSPELVNDHAFDKAWLVKVRYESVPETLLDPAAYAELVGE